MPSTVQGKAGKPITLQLSHGPATGYSWVLDLPAGVTLLQEGPGSPPPPGQELGSGGGGAVRVVAASKGHYRIAAKFVRPWQPDSPIATAAIDLIVD